MVDLVRRGRCDLVINTPQGSGARADGYLIREAALVARVPCVTTIGRRGGGARNRERARRVGAFVAGAHRRDVVSGQQTVGSRFSQTPVSRGARRDRLGVVGNEAVGRYVLLRLERNGIEPGVPGQFFMLEAPGRLLPRPMSLCLAPPDELAFLLDPIGPGTAR